MNIYELRDLVTERAAHDIAVKLELVAIAIILHPFMQMLVDVLWRVIYGQ